MKTLTPTLISPPTSRPSPPAHPTPAPQAPSAADLAAALASATASPDLETASSSTAEVHDADTLTAPSAPARTRNTTRKRPPDDRASLSAAKYLAIQRCPSSVFRRSLPFSLLKYIFYTRCSRAYTFDSLGTRAAERPRLSMDTCFTRWSNVVL